MMAFFSAYRLYFIIAGFVAAFGAGWLVHHWKTEAGKTAAITRGVNKAADASTDLEKYRVKTEIVYRTITKQVDKIIDRPIYRDRCFDDDGLRLANAALAGKLDGRMPGPSGD